MVLEELPGSELLVGKLHQIADQEPVPLHDAAEFRELDRPDHEKLAMSFRIVRTEPERGCLVALEHRTQPLDPRAAKLFARYWRAIEPGGALVTRWLLRAVRKRAESCLEPTAAARSA